MEKFKELLNKLLLGAMNDARMHLDDPSDTTIASLHSLVAYVQDFIEPHIDPCAGDSRDTGVW